ncbi:GIY-YIG nuclease family protein [bacterium]|nr:GIY-YIG nuclease family protein [bacterium]
MISEKQFAVYIMANDRPTLYVGVTSNLIRRVLEHKNRLDPKSFPSRYKLSKLVYYEFCYDAYNAIIREKQLKNLGRHVKIKLISETNPSFIDLFSKINS